jgi:hypothetical protein
VRVAESVNRMRYSHKAIISSTSSKSLSSRTAGSGQK